MSKPRIKYSEFVGQMRYAPNSLANIMERVIKDVAANPKMKQHTERELYHYRFMQEQPIGRKDVFEMNEQDIIDHVKVRANAVGKATTRHDIRIITSALKHARSTWADCKRIKLDFIKDALPFLQKNDLVGKGNTRFRVASTQEEATLKTFFQAENDRGFNAIRCVPDIIEFACISARRRGEICRITHGDVDYEQQIYWVRDMKHPTMKKGNDKFFILWPELAAIIKRQPRVDPNNPTERIFPINGNVLGQKFSAAVRALGIHDLHFHDLRGTAISRWMLGTAVPSQTKGMPLEDVRVCVSGHDNTKILEDVYDRRTSTDLKVKYLPRLSQPAPLQMAA